MTLIRQRHLARGPAADEPGSEATAFFEEWTEFQETMAPDPMAGLDTLS
ncbi:hypothetical protein [Spongiactinospora sp. 9N601]